MTWPQLVLIGLSLVYGVGSALIPVLNAEAYVIADQSAPDANAAVVVLAAVAVGVGQTAGKVILFSAARRGSELAVVRHRRDRQEARRLKKAEDEAAGRRKPPSAGRRRLDAVRARLASWTRTLLRLVGTSRWGVPIVALAAFVGLPPIYAVALVAGASTMRLPVFAVTVLVGRVARFVLIAEGAELGWHALFS